MIHTCLGVYVPGRLFVWPRSRCKLAATVNDPLARYLQQRSYRTERRLRLRAMKTNEALDLAAFKALHHPKVLIFESGHKNVGWDDYEKNHLKPELDAFKTFKFTRWEESSQLFGDTALVVAEIGYAIDTKDAKHHDATGVATLLLRRAKPGWQVIHSHWSTAR